MRTAAALLAVLGTAACDRVFGVEFDGTDATMADALPPGDWIAIETATKLSCGLRADRSLWCWGTNEATGALGVELPEVGRPSRVGTATWSSIATKHGHVCGIQDTDASLWCWGRNDFGQLGFAKDNLSHPEPQRVGTARWTKVTVGSIHTCGIEESGLAWCWGYGTYGQLGHGQFVDQPAPVLVAGGPWSEISAGVDHTCAIAVDGELYCWGANFWGQLGQPLAGSAIAMPGRVGMDLWIAVTTGAGSTCGILADGRLRCWGNNDKGQLGLGTTTLQVRPRPVGNDTGEWTAIRLGHQIACGLRAGGELWCWGDNEHDAIVHADAGAIASTPFRVEGGAARWAAVSTGSRHACAIADDGNLWCSGNDGAAQHGLGTGGARRVPTKISGELRASELALAQTTTCIVDLDGKLHCWGSDKFGSLGAESPGATHHPIAAVAPGTWSGLVGGFEDFYCALRDGVRACWGFGLNGQHGTSVLASRDVPVEDPGHVWTQVTAGLGHVCGIEAATHQLYCWGLNTVGQLGDGTATPRFDEGAPTAGGAQFLAIAAGLHHTCALDLSRALHCWGLGTSGQLGDGAAASVAGPKPIAPGPFAQISLGSAHTCAIAGMELACWGYNGYGQIGIGSDQQFVVAISRVPGEWRRVATGTDHTCAIDTTSALWCWGLNQSAQVGDGTFTNRTSPVLVSPGPWRDVQARHEHTCGIQMDGTVWCWGDNFDGQIGDGTAWTRELRWVPLP